MCGTEMTGQEIPDAVLKDRAFCGKEGGMTVSGGEPMLYADKCTHLLQLAKQAGINTDIETSGYFDRWYVEPLCKSVDWFLWDVKDTDPQRHLQNTGVGNDRILENLFLADTFGVPIILRCILLKDVNLNREHLDRIRQIYSSLKNAIRVDFLPCHSLGNAKRHALGEKTIDLTEYEPGKEGVQFARSLFKS